MPVNVNAPHTVTLYGTDEYFASDVDTSEVLKTLVTDDEDLYSSATIDLFILRPPHRIELGEETGGGNVQTNKIVIYQKFIMATTWLINNREDYADITGLYTDLIAAMNYKYHYLEVNTYYYALHTAGKLIKGVFKKDEPFFNAQYAFLDMEFEKERPL